MEKPHRVVPSLPPTPTPYTYRQDRHKPTYVHTYQRSLFSELTLHYNLCIQRLRVYERYFFKSKQHLLGQISTRFSTLRSLHSFRLKRLISRWAASPRRASNPRPFDYESGILTTELHTYIANRNTHSRYAPDEALTKRLQWKETVFVSFISARQYWRRVRWHKLATRLEQATWWMGCR